MVYNNHEKEWEGEFRNSMEWEKGVILVLSDCHKSFCPKWLRKWKICFLALFAQ